MHTPSTSLIKTQLNTQQKLRQKDTKIKPQEQAKGTALSLFSSISNYTNELSRLEIESGDPPQGSQFCQNRLTNTICGYIQRGNGTSLFPFDTKIDSQFRIQNTFKNGHYNQTFMESINKYNLNITKIGQIVVDARENAHSSSFEERKTYHFLYSLHNPVGNPKNFSIYGSDLIVSGITANENNIINANYKLLMDGFNNGTVVPLPIPSNNENVSKGWVEEHLGAFISICLVVGMALLAITFAAFSRCKKKKSDGEKTGLLLTNMTTQKHPPGSTPIDSIDLMAEIHKVRSSF